MVKLLRFKKRGVMGRHKAQGSKALLGSKASSSSSPGMSAATIILDSK